MACLHPLVRIDEELYNSSYLFNFLKKSNLNKKSYRGGYFFDLDYLVTFFEMDKDKKNFRDFLLSKNGVDIIRCNNCLSCRLKYSRDWSIRTFLQGQETKKDRFNYFLTLTYNDLNIKQETFIIPKTNDKINLNVLDKRDIQLFLKRFRKKYGDDIKYYLCGEYGSKTYRPHYHLILLNCPEIVDKEYLYNNGNNFFYSSQTISKLWEYGFNVLSDCSLDTIFYTSHYCLKKSGKSKIDLKTIDNKPFQNEFQLMSRRPGLGENFFLSRAYNENLNFSETNIKLNNLNFEVSSIQYYNYIFDSHNIWRPLNEYKKPRLLDLVYNNSYYTQLECEKLKQKIKYNDNIDLLRSSI